jgi:hypothetical protein
MNRPIDALVCWKCGASLAALTLPLRRLEECKGCGAELHVCRMCVDYDTAVAKSCREPIAEEVKEKERANFCDYFKPRPNAYQPRDETATNKSRATLEALFGGQPGGTAPAADSSRARLEEWFKKK